jgi:hypothetical protein
MSVRTRAMLLLVLALGISRVLLAEDDPFVGSWKNKKGGGINQYEPAGDGRLKVTVFPAPESNQKVHSRIETYDGKPHEVVGEEGTEAISVKRIDSHTIEGDNWLGGKPRAHFTVTVSQDGKTLTKKIKGTNKDGQAYEDIRISEKQEPRLLMEQE